MLFRRGHERQVRQMLLRVSPDFSQQRLEVVNQTVDGSGVKLIGVVLQNAA